MPMTNRDVQEEKAQVKDVFDEHEVEIAEQEMRYQMLSLFVEKCIKLFPKSVDLYILSSQI